MGDKGAAKPQAACIPQRAEPPRLPHQYRPSAGGAFSLAHPSPEQTLYQPSASLPARQGNAKEPGSMTTTPAGHSLGGRPAQPYSPPMVLGWHFPL